MHTRVYESPLTVLSWGDMVSDKNPKHPSYMLVTANTNTVQINSLDFDISSMQYQLMPGQC